MTLDTNFKLIIFFINFWIKLIKFDSSLKRKISLSNSLQNLFEVSQT